MQISIKMAEIFCEINAAADSCNDTSASYQLHFQYKSRLPSSAMNIHVPSTTVKMHITYSISAINVQSSVTNVQLSATTTTNVQCNSTTEVHMQCSTTGYGVQELFLYETAQEEEGPSEPSALCTGGDVDMSG